MDANTIAVLGLIGIASSFVWGLAVGYKMGKKSCVNPAPCAE